MRRSDLTAAEERLMYGLFEAHFEGVSRQQFFKDLDGKDWVILLDAETGGGIEGFSSLRFYDTRHRGATLGIVYSGDTIVDRAAWGRSALARLWIGAVNHLRRERGSGRLYWFLLVSGYRTYRFLPVLWREYYPRHDLPTPPETQDLIDHLAEESFGAHYHRTEGIVRLPSPQVLRQHLRGIPSHRLADPHVAFFAQRNPRHEHGDELVCLTEIDRDNLTAAGRRLWTEGERSFSALRPRP